MNRRTRIDGVREGEMVAFEVDGERIAVANVEGALHAFADTCTHARCSLADGDLEGTTVTCPCHGSQFDVRTGEVLAPPATKPVRVFRASVDGDEIRIEV